MKRSSLHSRLILITDDIFEPLKKFKRLGFMCVPTLESLQRYPQKDTKERHKTERWTKIQVEIFREIKINKLKGK
jgi:hypothetical protein